MAVVATPQCCTSETCCMSKEETFGPFLAYITSSHHIPKAAVIIASDVFGFKAPLLRYTVRKDNAFFLKHDNFFNKDPYVSGTNIDTWILKHQPVDSVPGAKQAIELLHKKGFSSVGAVGFCWGGKVVVELAKGKSLKAAVVAHPSPVTVEDIEEVETPIAILAAELDTLTPPALVQQFIKALKAKPEIQSFVRIYPGVAHGWTIRYNPDNPKEVADAEEAQRKMLEWLGRFLYSKRT